MRILVIICTNEMNICDIPNMIIFNNYIKQLENVEVDYVGISSKNDFNNYENVFSFKFKVINPNGPFSKMCDFITNFKSILNYDWYIKIRTEVKLLEPLNFNIMSDNAINARARVYTGPKQIQYGCSVNGEGIWKNVGDCHYDAREKIVLLDDMIYVFHNNIIINGGFNFINYNERQTEWYQSKNWIHNKIKLNVVGINLECTKYNTFSGNINM
jgi:hypothetical protein